nr:hypothetical protein [Actinokineospora spheciospongiae]
MGQDELDFEAEESTILDAVGDTGLDLLVEDTGDPVQLGSRLGAADGMQVVHLSCHGHNNWPVTPGRRGEPVLLMEDEVGAARPTVSRDLMSMLDRGKPQLSARKSNLPGVCDRAHVGGAVPGAGRGGHGRPILTSALVPRPDTDVHRTSDHAKSMSCGGGDRRGSRST